MPQYVVLPVDIDPSLVTDVEVDALPDIWSAFPPGPASQTIGDEWIARAASAALRVPSALIPGEFNYVLNPAHADFGALVTGAPQELRFDPRLLPG